MTAHRSSVRRCAALAAAATAALVLTACGGGAGGGSVGHNGHPAGSPSGTATGTTSPATEPGQHNAADVAFATGMIPHHRQAVQMAGLAATRAQSPQVKRLAQEIKKAQDPEIATLSGWLTAWGEPVPAEGADASGHAGHGAGDGAGMMSAEEMDRLGKASGQAFDTAFMELMIKHHEGAVEMARTEQEQGAAAEAKALAVAVVTAQSAEIDVMKGLLGRS
ncbi:DUF305 domain-containing protein [Streptomyces sp. cmx-4-9]|uniref:DUF305 domain-containing protein n=1 Tax=Streptomyces sp. cmx-4-9 TaxID=2790941 RepID=UPI00397EA810